MAGEGGKVMKVIRAVSVERRIEGTSGRLPAGQASLRQRRDQIKSIVFQCPEVSSALSIRLPRHAH